MYNIGLVSGLVFVVYVVTLVWIVMRRFSAKSDSGPVPFNRYSIGREKAGLVSSISAVDHAGKTVITWSRPVDNQAIATKIYLHVANKPLAAKARYDIAISENESERVTHHRMGRRFWYWVALVYANGSESEKQFIDVLPNDD